MQACRVRPELRLIRERALSDFYFFAKGICGYDKLCYRVHGPVTDILQDVGKTRVNITMPRKFFKSTLASVAYPLWRVAQNPNMTMLLVMNTVDNAKLKLEELKKHVTHNERFRAVFPDLIPDFNSTRWGAEAATINRTSISGTPTWNVAGATTAVVSRSVDEIIMDDLLTAKQDDFAGDEILPSNDDIQKAIGWYKGAISLLKSPKQGRLLNVGTRWARHDLVHYVLMSSKAFAANNIELKAAASWPDGPATFPEMYPMDVLREVEASTGSTIFRLWYLNEAVDPSEIIFDIGDEDFYVLGSMPDGWVDSLRKYTAVDLAFSSKERADNTAIVTIGVDDKNIRYVLDVQYGRMEPMDTIDRLFRVNAKWKPRVIAIETQVAQVLMSKFLRHIMQQRGEPLPIREIQRGGRQRKENRIMLALQPWVQQKMLKLARGVARDLEIEMRDFRLDEKRRGKDDALDALADAVECSTSAETPVAKKSRFTLPEEFEVIERELYDVDKATEELMGARKCVLGFEKQLAGTSPAYLQ